MTRQRVHTAARGFVYTATGVLVLALALLRWTGSAVLVEHSDSMAPALRAGDALLVRSVSASDVAVGQVVTLESPGAESTTHRLVESSDRGGAVHLVTRGDANNTSEAWKVPRDADVGVLSQRVPYVGYVVYWVGLTGVRVTLLAVAALTLVGIPWRPTGGRRRAPCAA